MRKVLLFIPMYNCEKQIKRVIGKLDGGVLEHITEVLVADNGSTDGSIDAARQALTAIKNIRVTLVRNLKNYSLGGSLKIAFNYCLDNDYDHCIVLHGDDQADIGDILPYLRDESFFSHACAFGSRFESGSRLRGYSMTRILGNRALNALASLAGGRRISDLGSGLNMYNAAYLKSRFYARFPDRLTFDVYLLLHCLWSGADFVFFPIGWSEEDQKSNARAFRQGVEILSLLLKYLASASSIFAASYSREPGYGYNIVYSHTP